MRVTFGQFMWWLSWEGKYVVILVLHWDEAVVMSISIIHVNDSNQWLPTMLHSAL